MWKLWCKAACAALFLGVLAGCATGKEEVVTVRESAGTAPLPYREYVVGGELPGSYALTVLLHGSGERGDDNQAQLKNGAAELIGYCRENRIKAVLLFPQCPKDGWWSGATLTKVEELLSEKTVKFKADRIYAVGLSMGGFGTWELALRDPERLTAAIAICGGGDATQGAKLTKLPMLVVHGSADTVVPVKFSREMVNSIWNAGGNAVVYQELPECGHDAWTPAFRSANTWKWLFSQK